MPLEYGPFKEPYCCANCKTNAGNELYAWFRQGPQVSKCYLCEADVRIDDDHRAIIRSRGYTLWFCNDCVTKGALDSFVSSATNCTYCKSGINRSASDSRVEQSSRDGSAKQKPATLVAIILAIGLVLAAAAFFSAKPPEVPTMNAAPSTQPVPKPAPTAIPDIIINAPPPPG